jgi:RNA polymerase sigma-70 factor, ECF subfamily
MADRRGSPAERFTEAYDLYYSVLYGAVYRKVGSVEEAEDLCQEIFIRLYRKLDGVDNIRAWLYGAMRIVMFDYYRSRGRSEADIESMLDDAAMAYVNGFRETRLIIDDALAHPETFAGETERSVFELVAISGFSTAEAARHLNISYRQARYAFEMVSRKIVSHLRSRGIESLEELL